MYCAVAQSLIYMARPGCSLARAFNRFMHTRKLAFCISPFCREIRLNFHVNYHKTFHTKQTQLSDFAKSIFEVYRKHEVDIHGW